MAVKGVVFDIKKYAIYDGPGVRTTVFFKGCPLRCQWCHNPESQKPEVETFMKIHRKKCLNLAYSETREVIGREVSVSELMKEIEKDTIFYDESGGGVTFSGGEPLFQPEFLMEVFRACRHQGIHTVVDTSGYAPWKIFRKILKDTDLFLYDVKLMDDAQHQQYTGVSNRLILENLKRLAKTTARIVIRIPLIPGITDTETNLNHIIRFLNNTSNITRINVLPYNILRADKLKKWSKAARLGKLEVQPAEELNRIKNKFLSAGFTVQIEG